MDGDVQEGSEHDRTSSHHLHASNTLTLPAHLDSNYSNDAVHKWAQVKGTVSVIRTIKAYRGSGVIPTVGLNLDTFTAQPHHQ